MTDLNDQEREALERRAQDAAGMSSSKYPGARARELIIWRSARRFEAALAAREDTERPDELNEARVVLAEMCEWFRKNDGKADDFGRLRFVIAGERILACVWDTEQEHEG